MMDALKQRIIDCIKENQPVTTDTLHQKLNVSRNTIRNEMAILRNVGAVHTQVSIGHFISKADFFIWLDNGGREYMTARGSAGNKRSQEMRRRAGTVRQCIANNCRKYGPLHGKEIADLMSVTYQRIASQICEMVRLNQLVKIGKSGRYMYAAVGDAEVFDGSATEDIEAPDMPAMPTNLPDIFTQCRNSEAMKRVLAFYGRSA